MNTNDLTTHNKNNTKAAEAPTTQEQNAASTVHSPSIISNKKATFVTLGCKLNYAETSTLRDRLTARGCMPAEEKETADICIVNTCSVTGEADAKCRHAIRSLHREHPNAFIAVMGCYAQLSGEDIAKIEGVDLVVGQEQKGRIIELIEEHYEAHSMGVKAETESHGGIFYTTPLKDIKTFVSTSKPWKLCEVGRMLSSPYYKWDKGYHYPQQKKADFLSHSGFFLLVLITVSVIHFSPPKIYIPFMGCLLYFIVYVLYRDSIYFYSFTYRNHNR